MKKTWLLAGGGIALLGLLACGFCIYWIFALTQPMIDAADKFLTLVGEGKTADAYAATATGFRAKQSETTFTAGVRQLELTKFASVSWHNRQVNNNEGTAEGTVKTTNEITKPIAMKLVNEAGQWKVVSVRYGGIDLADVKPPAPPVPDVVALRKLALETLLDFNEAVKSADFTAFYGKTSVVWKKESSPDKLKKGFQVFIDDKLDFSRIKDVVPEFYANTLINHHGLLEICGHYPTRPLRFSFTLRYHNDPDGWKISFIEFGFTG